MSDAETRYDLRLKLRTRYDSASDRVRLLTHLLPRELEGRQTLSSRILTVTPTPDERGDFPDFFQNTATMIAYHSPVDGVRLELRARVVCRGQSTQLDLSPRLSDLKAEIAGVHSVAPSAPHHFLGASARVPSHAGITAFAQSVLTPGQTVLGIVEAFCAALHKEIKFEAGATDVNTPIDTAFERRTGVCQDISHIMICGLRALGIPAGYVSGFLRTEPPAGQPRLEGADAMHAWVRAWCGAELGWVEFDPTNACRAGRDHVVVAYGRDYADVSPIRGVMVTAGAQSSHHSVDMVPI